MVWPVWVVQLIVSAVFFVVGELLRPKPDFEDAEAIPFGEARIPQVDPQRKQTVIWGRVRLTSPHLMDVTEYEAVPLTKSVKTGMFSGDEDVVIGHRYLFGSQLGFSKGVADIRKIYYDDEILWNRDTDPFTDEGDDGVVIDIDKPNFLGGATNGGGIVGRFRWYPGVSTQNRCVYLQGFQTPTPGYRWTSYLVLENVEVGETPNIDAFSIECDRYPDPLSLGANNRIDGDSTDSELNPMSIVAELMTDGDYGYTLTVIDDLNTAPFISEAGVLITELNGMSLKWTNNLTLERIIEQVNKQVDGMLRFNPKIGRWEYKLVRDDYSLGSLLTLDPSNSRLTDYGRANWSETINEVHVNYQQRDLSERAPPAVAQDGSNWRRQSARHKVLSLQFPGLYSKSTARNIASRELRGQSFTIANSQLLCNRVAWDLLPGDPFILAWPDEIGISQLVMRVGSMGFGDPEQTEIQISAIEDVFRLADNIFGEAPSSIFTSPILPPAQITVDDLYDQPYLWSVNDPSSSTPGAVHKPVYVASKPNGNSIHYRIFARQGTSLFKGETEGNFSPTGILLNTITENDGGNTDVIATVELENVAQTASLSTDALTETQIKEGLLNLAIVVSSLDNQHTPAADVYEPEIVAYEDAAIDGTNVTLTNVHRGLFDTLPIPASVGDRIWFISGVKVSGPGTTDSEYGATESVDIRGENVTSTGTGAQSDTETLTFRNRVNRPYPPAGFKFNTDRFPGLITLDADITFAWGDHDRTTDTVIFQNDANETIETGYEVVIRIYDGGATGGTLVRKVVESGSGITADGSETLDTYTGNSYNYTNAKQETDGGGTAMAQIRVEAQVIDAATELITSLLDVIRVVNVDAPLNLLTRGELYDLVQGQSPGVHFPMREVSGNLVDATGNSPDMTTNGTVAYNQPGPTSVDSAPFVPAILNSYLTIADSATNDLGGTRNWISFWFKAGPVDGVTAVTPILYKGSITDVDSYEWRIYLDTSGYLRMQYDTGVRTFVLEGEYPVDDGLWHNVNVLGQNGSHLWVDGQPIMRAPTGGNFNGSAAHPIVACGHNDSTSAGLIDIQMCHLSFWIDEGVVSESITSGNWDTGGKNASTFISNTYLAGILDNWPYLQTILSLDPSLHYEMNYGLFDGDVANGKSILLELANHEGGSNELLGPPYARGAGFTATETFRSGPLVGQRSYALQGTATTYTWFQGGIFNTLLSSAVMALTDPNTGDIETMSSSVWIKLRTGHSVRRCIWFIGDAAASKQLTLGVDDSDKLFIQLTNNYGTTNWRRITADDALSENVWIHVGFSKVPAADPILYVNGLPVDTTVTTNGAAPYTTTGAWAVDIFATVISLWLYGSTGTDSGDTANIDSWDGDLAHLTLWFTKALTGADFLAIYAVAFVPDLSMTEVLSLDNPQHVYPIESDTDAADLFDNSGDGQPTATGTFEADTLAIETNHSIGRVSGIATPAGFRGGELLEYATEIIGNLNLADLTLIVIARRQTDNGSNFEMIAGNENAANRTNLALIEAQTTGDPTFMIEQPAGSDLVGTPLADYSQHLYVIRKDSLLNRSLWIDGVLDVEDGSAEAYTNAAMTKFVIGDFTGSTSDFNGEVAYVAAMSRSISDNMVRRIYANYRGMNKHQSAIIQHNPDLLYMLDEDTVNGGEKYHNIAISASKDLISVNSPGRERTSNRDTLVNWIAKCRSAQAESASGASDIPDITVFPYTVGLWVRVDIATTDAYVAFSNMNAATSWLAIGIFDDIVGYRFGTPGGEITRTSGAVTQGTLAHLTVVFTDHNDKDIYLNGEFQSNNTSADISNFPSNIDTLGINAIVTSAGTTRGNGSYGGLFTISKALTAAEVMEIYSASVVDGYQGFVWRETPLMYYPLNEYLESQLSFHDMVDRSLVATGTGMSQGVIGIIPNRKDLCVDFDGTGEINLNRADYPSGSTNRVIEFWIEGGYVGVVCSMGDNTDAEALIVAIDASGDVRVHIRGSGNERIFTSTIDTGTEHHIAIELNGTTLTSINCYVDGVLATVGTAGSATTMITGSFRDLKLGSDQGFSGLPAGTPYIDATGKLQGFAMYGAEWGATTADSAIIANAHFSVGQP